MLVTGRPMIVSGMVTTPPGPVYLVMVIVPLALIRQLEELENGLRGLFDGA
jgi:hypothetical protein